LNTFNISLDGATQAKHYLNMFKTEIPTEKGEQTRKAIFASALQLFREKGFDATTMRDIAESAKVALGAAYYYFPSKEAIIQAYYGVVQAEHNRIVDEAVASGTLNLRERLKIAMQTKLDIVREDRKLLGVVFRYSGEPEHPLSCLGPATERTRRESIEIFSKAIGDEHMPKDLRELLPLALWALQMGMLILFIYDNSPGQQRTRKLVDGTLDLTVKLLSLAKYPMLKPIRSKVMSLLREAELIPQFSMSGGAAQE
jgi:AcrR family transcriptional regulator